LQNDITCTLRVTAPEREIARVAVRRHQFAVGRPLELDEASGRIAALEYALGAVAAEVVNGLRAFAVRRRIEIDAIEAVITGELQRGLAYLEVVGEPGPPTIARIRLQVFADAADREAVQRLWADVVERLPLVCTLRLAVPIELELSVTR
jgi:hypothetical protein